MFLFFVVDVAVIRFSKY